MHRRNMLTAATAAIGALFAAAGKTARAAPTTPDKSKVVYHLSDYDKVDSVLGNIKNHYEGVGGPDNVTIVLVVHGSALKAFHTDQATASTLQRTSEFSKAGLELDACSNSMRSQHVNLKDLAPGFVVADRGAVVRIAELQSQGYVYLRP
jgi:intracellular sulfur oxidation DsrE/DsrF family protein